MTYKTWFKLRDIRVESNTMRAGYPPKVTETFLANTVDCLTVFPLTVRWHSSICLSLPNELNQWRETACVRLWSHIHGWHVRMDCRLRRMRTVAVTVKFTRTRQSESQHHLVRLSLHLPANLPFLVMVSPLPSLKVIFRYTLPIPVTFA